jgi:hypothetical protein
MSVLTGLLLFVVGCVLPGLLVATALIRDREPLAVWTVGLVVAVFCLPTLQFSAAILMRTNIGPAVVLGVGAVVGAGAVLVARLRGG